MSSPIADTRPAAPAPASAGRPLARGRHNVLARAIGLGLVAAVVAAVVACSGNTTPGANSNPPSATETPTAAPTLAPSHGPVGWSATGSMAHGRALHTATLLTDGRVLVAGGQDKPGASTFASAELYDPATGSFSPTGSMTTPRDSHVATRLKDGRVLITGGEDLANPGDSLASAEIYDPGTGTFSATGSMAHRRYGNSSTLLPSGRVLITGGYSWVHNASETLASAELYDPKTGTFSATGSMAAARAGSTATLLSNGRVLIAGGGDAGALLGSAELYDPATGSFSATGSLITARATSATLLADGRVLIAGGGVASTTSATAITSSAEIYNPKTGTFGATGSMTTTRGGHTATLLSDGRVLLAGGDSDSAELASAELYAPGTGAFSPAGSMPNPRYRHQATLLLDGRVLITGGEYGGLDSVDLSTCEIYQP